jgi:predicted nuclease of restriction endonuclease-like RecB superfamily
MLFRRQDIPKTTRTPKEGGTRRIYPRFIRDKRPLPKIDLAIEYLTEMVGHKRSELSQRTVTELLGEPKLARCLLACLGDHFHHETPGIEDVIGSTRAAALLDWGLETPADLRAFIYRLTNDRIGGFVTGNQRDGFLAKVAQPLGLDAAELSELLHLDADRNAILRQRGEKPKAHDVVASYNARLVLSTLRQASRVTLALRGISDQEIELICSRHDIQWRVGGSSAIELYGRRDSHGSFSRHGGKLARCVHQLILQAETVEHAAATVYLQDRPLEFVVDNRTIDFLRPRYSFSADGESITTSTRFADELSAFRSETGIGREWILRRSPECRVVEGALILPEVSAVRDHCSVDLIVAPDSGFMSNEVTAIRLLSEKYLVVVVGTEANGLQSVKDADSEEIFEMLQRIFEDQTSTPELATLIRGLIRSRPFIPASELLTLVGSSAHHHEALRDSDQVVFLPDLGLFERARLQELESMATGGMPQISALRTAAADRFGDEVADALTIRLLSHYQVVPAAA